MIGQPIRGGRSERGSALLIVFVFASVVAILLYKELPIAVFEARRTKEEVLENRGHEYQRAVQLYYRRFKGQYPASFDQLENTNSMRFLRKRYKDPFTGKDDWRLLHAGGPSGQLIDSKVNPLPLNGVGGQNGQSAPGGFGSSASSFGSNSGSSFGSNSGSGFGSGSNTGFGSGNSSATTSNSSNRGFGSGFASSSDSGTATEVPSVPKRAPVVDAAGTTASGETPSSSELSQDPSIPLLPSSTGRDRGNAAAPGTVADGSTPQSPAGATPGQPGPTATGAPNTGLSTVSNATNSTTTGSNGTLMSGGLAGVASKAKGLAIKKVNDQTDYSLWEFWYDPTKDTSMGNGTNMRNGAGGQNVQNGTSLGQPATGSGFGSGTNSLFNNTNNSSQPTSSPAPTTAPNFAPPIPGASQQQPSGQPPPNPTELPNDGSTPVAQPPPIPQQG